MNNTPEALSTYTFLKIQGLDIPFKQYSVILYSSIPKLMELTCNFHFIVLDSSCFLVLT